MAVAATYKVKGLLENQVISDNFKKLNKMKIKTLKSVLKLRLILFTVSIFYLGLCYSQTYLDDYSQFTTERRLVLNKISEFFDETIRKNFPAEIDTLSYLKFMKCIAVSSFENVILNVDRVRLKEINQMLFKDHNYYFFYSQYIYMGKIPPTEYLETIVEDSIPTRRVFGTRSFNGTFGVGPILNFDGYIKVVPDDNPIIRNTKEDIMIAGDLSITIFLCNVMRTNVREISHPIVKELCAVVFWRYICSCACIDLIGRKSFCEPTEL